MAPTVYLDCDGVLTDFDHGAARLLVLPREFERPCGQGRFWRHLAAATDFLGTLDTLPEFPEFYGGFRHLHPVTLTGLPVGD